ncbi:MAG: ABC transporter substrate-binding protein [Flavobacteriales bacterium]
MFFLIYLSPFQRPSPKGPVVFGGKLRFSTSEIFNTVFPLSSNTLDYQRVLQLVFEPVLIAADNPRGWNYNLAKSIRVSKDQKTIFIKLRKGVYFSKDACFRFSSRELTAKDLAFTLSYACSKNSMNRQSHLLTELITGAKQFYFQNKNPIANNVSGVQVVDKYTVKIQLSNPYNHFLSILSNNSLGVLSLAAAKYYKSGLPTHPIGTGAFYLSSKKENKLSFLRNNDYWKHDLYGNQLPYLDEVIVNTCVSSSKEHRLFSANHTDLLFDLPVNQLPRAFGTLQDAQQGKNPLHEVYIKPSSKIHYLYFNANKKPFDQILVRKAVFLAIDPEQICSLDLNGEGIPMKGKFIPERKGYRNELLEKWLAPTNLLSKEEKTNLAKILLKQAGYGRENPFPKVNMAVRGSNNSVAGTWCRAVQKMLQEKLGITIDLIYNDQNNKQLSDNHIDIWRGGWVGDYPGSESYLRLFYSGAQKPIFFRNKAVDNLYLSSVFDKPIGPLMILHQKQCELEIIQNFALVPVYTEDFFVIHQLQVRGFKLAESGLVDFSTIFLKEF